MKKVILFFVVAVLALGVNAQTSAKPADKKAATTKPADKKDAKPAAKSTDKKDAKPAAKPADKK